ncbi:MAG: ATP-binding protein [Calditrichia bacterium]
MFQLVIQTTDQKLTQLLEQQLILDNVEIFKVSTLLDAEQLFARIKADLFVLTVEAEVNSMRGAIHTVNTICEGDNSSVVLLLGEQVDVNELRLSIKNDRVSYQDANSDIDLLSANIASIISIERRLKRSHHQERFEEFLETFQQAIRNEGDSSKLFSLFVNVIPKLLSVKYVTLAALDSKLSNLHYHAQFQPPMQPLSAATQSHITAILQKCIKVGEAQLLTPRNRPELFQQIRGEGWKVDRLKFLPMLHNEISIGGLLMAAKDIDNRLADSEQLLNRALSMLSKRLTTEHLEITRDDDDRSFSDKLISNHLDQSSILQHASKELARVTRASSAIFWQYNKGFGFLFPKHSYFSTSHSKVEGLEKNLIFLAKEKYLAELINKGLFKRIESIGEDDRLAESTQSTFQKVNYKNALLMPVRLQNEISGLFIVNKTSESDPISLWEVYKAEEVLKRTQTVLEDSNTVKEANFKLKQLARIFELGSEIKLDVSLKEILRRIINSVRKTLGWNDIAILLEDELGENLSLDISLGFDNPAKYNNLPLSKPMPVKSFMGFLKQCEQISSSYFYDARSKLTQPNDKTGPLNLTEWDSSDLLVIPLETRNEILGYLAVGDPVDRLKPTPEKVVPLEYYANQASVAVENTNLYERLKASQERYRSLAETMSMGLLTCNKHQQIAYVNPAFCKLLGRDMQDLIGLQLKEFFSLTSHEGLDEVIDKLLDQESDELTKIENLEFDLKSKSGEVVPVSLFGFPLFEQRVKTGFFLILNDLRVIKRLERMKSDFNSMIVHDLRSPMNVIQGFLELIRNKVVGDVNEEQEELLDISKENVKKVLTLVDNFLVASKLEVGKFRIDKKLDEINNLVRQQVENHKVLVKNKQIDMQLNLDENLPLLQFDSLRIEQVVNNLLSNAMKFTPERGKIFVASALEKSQENGSLKYFAKISVQDTGIGIPVAKIAHIFEKYEQVEEGQSFNVRGTGLGLSICKEIVDLHNGRIWVESPTDAGSTFSFLLPIDSPAETDLSLS